MKNLLLIVFLIFSLTSCSDKKTSFNYIQTFMKDNYNVEIKDKTIRLFFIPSNQCITCLRNNDIKAYIVDSNYLIITDAPRIKEMFGDKVVFDKNAKQFSIKENNYSNSIWDISDNKVSKITTHIQLVDTTIFK